jgi:hypothetical protein
VLLPAAAARAQTHAICEFQAHVTLSAPLSGSPVTGDLRSDGPGSAQCTGYVANRLVDRGGYFDIDGTYESADLGGLTGGAGLPTLAGASACVLGSARVSFNAAVPIVLALFSPNVLPMSGSGGMEQAADGLTFSGSGLAGGQTVTYTGAGTFTPDGGQGCQTGVHSGTLDEQVLVADGPDTQSGPAPGSGTDSSRAASSGKSADRASHTRCVRRSHSRRSGRHSKRGRRTHRRSCRG